MQYLIKDKKKITKAKAFNLITFRYIDCVLSIDNPKFAKQIPLVYIVPLNLTPMVNFLL